MNRDGPEIDKGEDGDVCEFLHGEEKGKDVVWNALREAIEGVEGVACKRRRHNPLVVRLV